MRWKRHGSGEALGSQPRGGSGGRREPLRFATRVGRRHTQSQRQRRQRFSRSRRPVGLLWRRFLIGGTLAALFGGAVYFPLGSDAFAVRSVMLHGTRNVAVAAAIAQQHLVGENLLLLDTGMVTRRIASLPEVAHVTVERDWPHRVVITVALRQPVVAWKAPGGLFMVDAMGVVIGQIEGGNTRGGDVVAKGGISHGGWPARYR